MPVLFQCPQGHGWSVAGDPAGSSVCPVCGSSGVATIGPGQTIPDDMPPPPGRTLPPAASPAALRIPGYEIESELGRGGMGVVYKARQLSLNRVVALKQLRAAEEATPEEVARFRAEAEAVAAVQHPHIVQVFDVVEHAGRVYCALEYVPGGSLAERMAGTPLPPHAAAELVATLARAVQHAHDRGIVHRDLKPANVLLAPDGTPKLTDFGLAKRMDRGDGMTRTGAVLGTPCYMAPEQADGRPSDVGPWTDVYALGAILYECLAGRPPFRGESMARTLRQVVEERPVPPGRLRPGIPHELDAICLKCLEKEPRNRYPSAAALAEDLRRFPGTPQPIPGSRQGSRRYLIAAGVLAVLVGVGVLVVNALRPQGQQELGAAPPDSPPGGTGPQPAADGWGWELLPAIAEGEKFDRLAFPTRTVGYAASRTALHKTEDGGKTWRRLELPGGPPGRVFVLHFENVQVGWLGTDQLRHTRDGGRRWETIAWPGDRQMKAVTALAIGAGGWAVAGGRTTDGKLTLARRAGPSDSWQAVELPPEFAAYESWFLGCLAPARARAAVAVLFEGRSGGGVVLRTEDAGENWGWVRGQPDAASENFVSAGDLFHARIAPDGRGWLAGEDRGFWRTADAGKTWQPTASPERMEAPPAALGLSPDGRLAVMPLCEGRVAVSCDGGAWSVTQLGTGFGYSMPGVAVVDGECAFVLAADGRIATFRGGLSRHP